MTDLDMAGATFFRAVTQALQRVSLQDFDQVVRLLDQARANGRRVYAMGNGGSATTAMHLACDLANAGTNGLRVMALPCNVAVVTALANDTGYERVFADQVERLAEPDDVVVGISVSGRSPNILAGFRAAKAVGAHTIGLLGPDDALVQRLADVVLVVPSRDYGTVESIHMVVVHALATSLGTARGLLRPGCPTDAEAGASAGADGSAA